MTSRYAWSWRTHADFILGISESNLAIFTQLVKGDYL